jgi:hypothetical protein
MLSHKEPCPDSDAYTSTTALRPHAARPGGVRHVDEVVACSCQMPAYANSQLDHRTVKPSLIRTPAISKSGPMAVRAIPSESRRRPGGNNNAAANTNYLPTMLQRNMAICGRTFDRARGCCMWPSLRPQQSRTDKRMIEAGSPAYTKPSTFSSTPTRFRFLLWGEFSTFLLR